MVHEDPALRCIHAACARPLPRKVNFCPFCGTGQDAGVDHPAHAAGMVRLDAAAAASAGADAVTRGRGAPAVHGDAGSRANMHGTGSFLDRARTALAGTRSGGAGEPDGSASGGAARAGLAAPATDAASSAATAGSIRAPGRAAPDAVAAASTQADAAGGPGVPARAPRPTTSAFAPPSGQSGGAVPPAGSASERASAPGRAPAAPLAAARPAPRPVRLRTLLLVFGVLWVVWHVVRPDPFADRVERAVTLASVCSTVDAQRELTALENDGASSAQLARIRGALASAQPACQTAPAPQRRGAHAPSRPRAGAGGTTIGTAAPHPPAARAGAASPVAPVPGGTGSSTGGHGAAGTADAAPGGAASRLVGEARAQIGLGNYRVAVDRMDVCLAMTDGTDGECARVRALARRLQGEMEHCLSGGGDWVGAHCE